MSKGILRGISALVLTVLLSVPAFAGQPQVIAAKFHSDNCGSCKVIAPELSKVTQASGEKPVLFIKFDRTDEATTHNSEMLASSLGITDIYEATPKTGVVLLIDAESKEVRGKLNKTLSADEMSGVIDRVLAGETVMMEDKGSMDKMDKMKDHSHDKGSDHMHKEMKGSN